MGRGGNVCTCPPCFSIIYIRSEGFVVVFAAGEASVDNTDEFRLGSETEFFVGSTIDVVVENIFDALLCQSETRHKLIIGSKRRLELHRHPRQHRIYALLVHLGKTQSALFQEQMAGVLTIVQVVGIVDNALDVALIVAHLHPRLKNILRIHIWVQR